MIQKRYETFTSKGKVWLDWSDYEEDDSKLDYLQKEEYWQLKPKLRNEYRIKP